MGYKYYDANGDFTNPADNPNLKYYRGDGVFAKADMDHKFYDATGDWSVPELAPPIPQSITSPQDLLNASAAAATNPTEVYEALKDQLTPAISFGSTYGSHQYRIVGVNKENATAGGKAGLVLLPEECMNQLSAQRSSNANSGGFANNATMISTLQAIYNAMDPAWRAIITPVDIPYSTSKTAISTLTNQTLFLPSMWNIGLYDANYCAKEGECWDYFIGTPETVAEPKRVRNYNGSAYHWWLRSGHFNLTAYFAHVNADGSRYYYGASHQRGVVPGFCV